MPPGRHGPSPPGGRPPSPKPAPVLVLHVPKVGMAAIGRRGAADVPGLGPKV